MDPRAQMQRLIRAIDAADWDALRSLFAPDLVYEVPGRPPVVGIEALMHYYGEERRVEQARHEISGILTDGDWAMSWGHFHAAAPPVETRFTDLCHFRNGLIDQRTVYFFSPPA